jgi:hypothetical protein
MTRISNSLYRSSLIALLLTSGVVLAQDQPPVPAQSQPPANGGWRRVGDAPTTPPATDPTEPTYRSDSYGQPANTPPPAATMPQAPQQMPQQSAPPANRPAYGVPPVLTLRNGTFFTIRTNEMLASNKNRAGDMFTGMLAQPIIANGVILAERGQTVAGTVAEVGKDKNGKNFIRLSLTTLTIADGSQIPVQTQLSSIQGHTTPGGVEAGTVIGTTAMGAAIGGAAAWGEGAAIGAGAGAIVGLAAIAATHNHAALIYPETALTFQLTSPVTVATTNSPQAYRFTGPQDYQPAPALRRVAPAPGYGYPAPTYAYPGYAYPAPYYYGPAYPYYWGPSFGVVVGRGWGWGRRW